ncbi:Aldo-ket-red domain-containing protein [Mycena indigotica]|uniref:Aldo-ket-red domain-containing protein n=1 Tax=Mycena indigotica TaxID=2126181 RepID=A0A8H6WET9_9AGAR|nr:Aldo-ket-red domain-containing protein [Mycena indigotica]KAF7316049.1 Aldo-ket-red domain-containing protein [Mycena indigotica]
MTTSKSPLNIVFGAMTVGAPETRAEGARVTDVKEVEAMLDVFVARGYREVDTARFYCKGTSEEYLGKVDWKAKGILMETKLYPTKRALTMKHLLGPEIYEQLQKFGVSHTPEDVRKHLALSLDAVKTDCLEMFYLHGPDRATPYEVTLKAVDELYREGKFKRFGISNYAAWEVAEIVGICKANGYILPTVYQGVYNAIQRTVEPELFPALRKFGISFYAFSPLSGGFFTGKYTSMDAEAVPGSRLNADNLPGKSIRARYWNEPNFAALAIIRPVIEKYNLTMPEVGLRWVAHHSKLQREHGDAIIIGASNIGQLKSNLDDLEKGPLPDDVVEALDEAWNIVKAHATVYFH